MLLLRPRLGAAAGGVLMPGAAASWLDTALDYRWPLGVHTDRLPSVIELQASIKPPAGQEAESSAEAL